MYVVLVINYWITHRLYIVVYVQLPHTTSVFKVGKFDVRLAEYSNALDSG